MTDLEHWQSLKSGNQAGLKHLYEANFDALFHYGIKVCKDQDLTFDLIQDLFVHIWESRARLGEPSSVKGYLLTAFKNRYIDHYRKIKKKNEVSLSNTTDPMEASFEDDIIYIETLNSRNLKIAKALERLSPKQKEAIHLRYVENISYEDISNILNINYQSVRNLVHRAITILRNETMVFCILMSTFLI